MKILFLAQRVPYPPNKGDKVRSFQLLRHLAGTHQVALVSFVEDRQELDYRRELAQYCHSIDLVERPAILSKVRALCALPTTRPLTFSYFFSRQLQQIVRQRLRNESFDLIFVYCSSMAQYVEHVRHIPRVIDFVDVDSAKWAQYAQRTGFPRKLVYQLESRRLRRQEADIARSYQHSFLVSTQEVSDFHAFVAPCPTVTPLLMGVDGESFRPRTEPYAPFSLVFTGTMDYFANVATMCYFVREVLPKIEATIPEVKLYIVGRNPAPEIVRLREQHPNVIVTGAVAHVQPYIENAAAFVAPMQIARGVQNKILEAMAMGIPVVTTSLGAHGLTVKRGEDLLVADTAGDFADHVINILQKPALRQRIGQNGRANIETNYHWETNLRHLSAVLEDVQARWQK